MRQISIGEITGLHGVKGEVRVWPTTDYPDIFFRVKNIILHLGEEIRNMEIQQARKHKDLFLLKFKDVDDRDSAYSLRSGIIKISEDVSEPLAEDEYFIGDLYDMSVVGIDGKNLGIITEIIFTGANDVYTVQDTVGNKILIPAIKECVKKVDLHNRVMTVALLPGL